MIEGGASRKLNDGGGEGFGGDEIGYGMLAVNEVSSTDVR